MMGFLNSQLYKLWVNFIAKHENERAVIKNPKSEKMISFKEIFFLILQ